MIKWLHTGVWCLLRGLLVQSHLPIWAVPIVVIFMLIGFPSILHWWVIINGFSSWICIFVSPSQLPSKQSIAGHDPFNIISGDVKVGDSIYTSKLDGSYVIGFGCFLLGAWNLVLRKEIIKLHCQELNHAFSLVLFIISSERNSLKKVYCLQSQSSNSAL